jgi:hypothetical protein
MDRTAIRSVVLIAAVVFAGAAPADVTGVAAGGNTAEPSQGFIVAVPPESNGTAAANMAANIGKEAQRLPATEVSAYRDDRSPCDRRQGTGQDACRAQLAAKYAEMDKLCRQVSGTEIPVCIKSAYAPD